MPAAAVQFDTDSRVPAVTSTYATGSTASRVRARCAGEPGLEIARDGLAVHEKLVHERLPRPDRQPARRHERPDPPFGLGPDLEVVVDRRQLAVEREAQALVGLERVEHLVDDVDERHAERLERPVPLPVPVRMRDEIDQVLTDPAKRPCTK